MDPVLEVKLPDFVDAYPKVEKVVYEESDYVDEEFDLDEALKDIDSGFEPFGENFVDQDGFVFDTDDPGRMVIGLEQNGKLVPLDAEAIEDAKAAGYAIRYNSPSVKPVAETKATKPSPVTKVVAETKATKPASVYSLCLADKLMYYNLGLKEAQRQLDQESWETKEEQRKIEDYLKKITESKKIVERNTSSRESTQQALAERTKLASNALHVNGEVTSESELARTETLKRLEIARVKRWQELEAERAKVRARERAEEKAELELERKEYAEEERKRKEAYPITDEDRNSIRRPKVGLCSYTNPKVPEASAKVFHVYRKMYGLDSALAYLNRYYCKIVTEGKRDAYEKRQLEDGTISSIRITKAALDREMKQYNFEVSTTEYTKGGKPKKPKKYDICKLWCESKYQLTYTREELDRELNERFPSGEIKGKSRSEQERYIAAYYGSDLGKLIKQQPAYEITEVKNKRLSYDLYYPDQNLVIEYDGEQHFNSSSNWWRGNRDRYEEAVMHDVEKTAVAIRAGLKVVRIGPERKTQTDIQNFLANLPELDSFKLCVSKKTTYSHLLTELSGSWLAEDDYDEAEDVVYVDEF